VYFASVLVVLIFKNCFYAFTFYVVLVLQCAKHLFFSQNFATVVSEVVAQPEVVAWQCLINVAL